MHTKQRTFKKAIIIIGTLLAAMLAGKWLLQGRQRFDCTTLYGRVSYLADNGWEVDAESEELQYVTLPDRLPDVMQSYNELQLQQGFDLTDYLGMHCTIYTYKVTNYKDYSGTVYAALYVCGRHLIAADIHAAALDGFMHGVVSGTC